MKKILTLIILLLSGSAWGTQTQITSLPTTISSGSASDTFYLAQNFTVSGYAILVNGTADSITIDLGGFTIIFDTSANSNTIGVSIAGVDFVTLMNGRVNTGYEDTSSVEGVRGVAFNNTQGTTIRGVHVTFGGYSYLGDIDNANNGFYSVGGANNWMNRMVSCSTTNNIVGFIARADWLSSSIYQGKGLIDALITNPTTEYHLWVDSCWEAHARHAAFLAYPWSPEPDAGVIWATDNNFTIDARNDGPWTGAYRYGESYGIALEHCSYVKIQSNTIQYDSSFFGGQGIFLANLENPFSGYFSDISGNTIRASIGPLSADTTSNVGHNTGIRVRFSKSVNIHDNEIYSYSDNDPTTFYRTGYATGIFIGYDNATGSNDSVYIYNNRIHVNTDGDEAAAISIMSNCDTCALVIHYNHLYSNSYLYHTATDGGGAYNIISYGDTLEWEGTRTAGSYTLVSGVFSNAWNAYNNEFRDFYLVNGVSDTNIYFTGTAGLQEYELFKTLNITIQDTLSQPIPNAICTVWNNLGNVVLIDTSDVNGLFSGITRYWYEHNTAVDSVTLQPFDIRIWNSAGADSVGAYDWVMINESGSRDTTLTLSATEGSGCANITHVLDTTALDSTTVTVRDNHSAISYDTIKVYWNTVDNIASADSMTFTTSLTDPYSANITGLIQNTLYYYWFRIYHDDGQTDCNDLSASSSFTTTLQEIPSNYIKKLKGFKR